MSKRRKISKKEKLALAKRCLSGEYGVCEAGLEDRPGQCTVQQQPRTPEEEQKTRIAQLEHALYMTMFESYITYYNNRRVQRNLGVLTPMEKHYSYPLTA